jgi:Domain of unknown function (DUF6265)
MRIWHKLVVVLIVLSVAASDSFAAERPRARVANLGWMAGCWETRSTRRLVEEQWMVPRGGLMLGMSRTVRGDTLVEYEVVRMEERGDSLFYVANPVRQSQAQFLATSSTDSSVVFENPHHDFPKKISYYRTHPDSVVARVEGELSGRNRVLEFRYARVPCAPR